jgi:hypothetical protein
MVRSIFVIFFSTILFKCLSQTLEFYDIKKLPVINSTAEEGMPLLSADGTRLFFTRALFKGNEGGEYGGEDIWVSENKAGKWTAPINNFASLNNRKNNVVVGLGAEGKAIYFTDGSRSQRMNGVFKTLNSGSGWSRPQLVPIPGIDNLDFIGFYVSPDEDVIFLSMKNSDSRGNEDLYYTMKDKAGLWIKPKNLGATINSTGFEISPFLSADKKRLYFASDGHKGEGDADIFYSERLYDSWETWSVPVNLGPSVNSKKFDAYFSVYGDSVFYFSSNRDSEYADIFSGKVRVAKTVLAKGQHYLSADEWSSTVGKNVSTDFKFPHESSVITAAQKELIFYIVNKLMLERDIKFHLVVKEEEDGMVSQDRIKVLSKELNLAGIDPSRIVTEQIFPIEKTQRGVIEMKLFK